MADETELTADQWVGQHPFGFTVENGSIVLRGSGGNHTIQLDAPRHVPIVLIGSVVLELHDHRLPIVEVQAGTSTLAGPGRIGTMRITEPNAVVAVRALNLRLQQLDCSTAPELHLETNDQTTIRRLLVGDGILAPQGQLSRRRGLSAPPDVSTAATTHHEPAQLSASKRLHY
jgi:hypothetical protein